METVEPYYLEGLIFAVPFIAFGLVTFFTVNEKLKMGISSAITAVLIVVLGFTSLLAFIYIAVDVATTTINDTDKYQRVLKVTGYPDNPLIQHFTEKIPGDAKNIVFQYYPGFLQGGTLWGLRFQADPNSIENYIYRLSKMAKCIGKPKDSQAQSNGIFSGTFTSLGYFDLPEDFIIFVIYSKSYKPDDWNHGQLSLAAVSQQRNEVIFLAEDW
ncbi:hypothetical protein [Caldicoprobacter faecalis]|uniref:hypothetical protein n=1 Tax=Caldicoprobacter faecalis TaxID=937334 RepID=UPI001A9A4CBF|nr:hypothetical protein [Caldicoprobacter faecalis]